MVSKRLLVTANTWKKFHSMKYLDLMVYVLETRK